ncbi:MAG TPA: 4a-hydroxytetrahydrobiopterin dehydratase [Acidiferrobacterales bacterium]|nr:4a-hydroxytetrahydrobiopterin dehydratase [Acidiferrobacterales bacterium]
MTTLLAMSCKPHTDEALGRAAAEKLLREIPGWAISDDAKEISRVCKFGNYYETLAFVNAQAWVVHHEDHHPDLEVGYNRCRVRFSTHSVHGLSENDFICVARINALHGAQGSSD